jgi:hypothetical protein
VVFGLIALVLAFRAGNSWAQATDPNIVKCVPNVPSAGDVLITGGEDLSENPSGNTEFFHPATGAWISTCPTKVAHDEARLLPYGTGLIEIGGEQSKVDVKKFHIMNKNTEVYVPATGKFKAGPALKIPLEDFAAVKLANGSIMVAGGVTGTDTELPVQTAEILSDKSWKKLKAKMTIPRAAPCAAVMTGGSKSGQLLIAGGTNTSENTPQLNTAELYDPAAGTFTATSHNMIAARAYAVATALPNGKVLITGGIDDSFDAINIAEIYDPSTDTFTQTNNNMSSPRVDHSATLLPDGTVLVAGGETSYNGGSTKLNTAEIYDPSTRLFTSTATMNDHRDDNTATVISGSGTGLDGKVLIEGGFFSDHAENTAEIYDPAGETLTPTANMKFSHGAANAAVIP